MGQQPPSGSPYTDEDRQRLRATFEEVAQLYDRARPLYPAQLFDDLVALAQLPEGARILEIGCGTGQATSVLAARGFHITCVELGAQLAAIAQANLAHHPNVQVINADFETWQPTTAGFDAVAAFTSFHWINPDRRYTRTAELLRPGGTLAIAGYLHVLPDDGDPFFHQVQDDYAAVIPNADNRPNLDPSHAWHFESEIQASGLFHNIHTRRYQWDVTYTAEQHIAMLDTTTDHRNLPARTREQLYERIKLRIDARPQATVRKTYLATLNIAQQDPSASTRSS